MEQLIASPRLDGPAASGTAGKPKQPNISATAPTFLPVKISDSGALVLNPCQTEDDYMKQFQKLLHSKGALEKAGYVMQPLTQLELDQKKKCARCHKFVFKKAFKHTLDGNAKRGSGAVVASSSKDSVGNARTAKGSGRSKEPPSNGSKKECKYHTGHFNGHTWSCCRATSWGQPCQTADEHRATQYKPGELEQQYRYYRTPAAAPGSTVRRAVAIDCEMGTGLHNETLCIRVSAVDYFTAEVLLDQLVFPDEQILNYNTRFSGVTHSQMVQAKRMGDCLLGIAAARRAIWKFTGPDTIVVAHSGQNDLNCLRWLHANIVDTFMVEALPIMEMEKKAREEAGREKKAEEERMRQAAAEKEPTGQAAATKVEQGDSTKNGPQLPVAQKSAGPQKPTEQPKKKPKSSGRFSLKTLTKERVGRDIQTGKTGHDSVKDAVATRDVAHWNVVNFGHGFYKIEKPSS